MLNCPPTSWLPPEGSFNRWSSQSFLLVYGLWQQKMGWLTPTVSFGKEHLCNTSERGICWPQFSNPDPRDGFYFTQVHVGPMVQANELAAHLPAGLPLGTLGLPALAENLCQGHLGCREHGPWLGRRPKTRWAKAGPLTLGPIFSESWRILQSSGPTKGQPFVRPCVWQGEGSHF